MFTTIFSGGYIRSGKTVYDADGERTVKMHGGGTASYENAGDSTVTTARPKYALYVSPYFTLDEDYVYVKHVYMGNDRIVSKMAKLSQDPRGADIANFEGKTSLAKLRKQKQALESAIDNNYAALGVPFKSVDYDDFEYNTNPDFSRQAQTQAEVLYYYHKDHLGSSLYLTDANGQTTQHVEYMPYGEMFVEQHDDGTWATPYRFTGKEYDEETGLIYFGARYFDPKIVIWYSTDELENKTPYASTYAYCDNNPIVFYDQEGKEKLSAINYRSGNNAPANRIIMRAVRKFQDDSGVINIWAHGNKRSMAVYYRNTGRTEQIKDSKSFVKFLKTNSRVWNKLKEGEKVTIVLHSCNTGVLENGEGLAQSLSKDIPNAIIIAPDHTVKVGEKSGERGVFYNKPGKVEKMGHWNQFENGKLTKVFPGDAKVGSSDFIQNNLRKDAENGK